MIINVNFIGKEFSNKLEYQKIILKAAVVVIALVGIEFGAAAYFGIMVKSKEDKIVEMAATTDKLNKDKLAAVQEKKGIPDLTGKINILNDLFAQKNLRFSEILHTIMIATPDGLWFTGLEYSNMKIILKGNAMDEMKIYSMERGLKDTGKFSDVRQEYIREIELNKNLIKDFQYELTLLEGAYDTTALATEAAITATGAAVNGGAAK